jgi:hypothetical protein
LPGDGKRAGAQTIEEARKVRVRTRQHAKDDTAADGRPPGWWHVACPCGTAPRGIADLHAIAGSKRASGEAGESASQIRGAAPEHDGRIDAAGDGEIGARAGMAASERHALPVRELHDDGWMQDAFADRDLDIRARDGDCHGALGFEHRAGQRDLERRRARVVPGQRVGDAV